MGYSRNDSLIENKPVNDIEGTEKLYRQNIRPCPECGFLTIFGMPGGRDAVCKNCGFKDPCCND